MILLSAGWFIQGTFLPLVVPSTIFQASLWSMWLIILCSLKVFGVILGFICLHWNWKSGKLITSLVHIMQMFQALARDRLERLNASPSATPWTYFRVFSVLLLVLFVDLFWYCFKTNRHR